MADGYISQIKTPDNKVYDFRDQHLKVYTGSCTTAAGTAIKDVTTDGEFTLAKGAVIFVNFSATNTAAVADLKLRVNSNAANDAKPIKHEYNASEANLPGVGYLRANQTYQFYYDGTNWVTDVGRDANSTYSYMRPYENTGKGSYNSQGENPAKTGSAGWRFQLSAGKYFMYSHYYDNTAKSALTLNIGSTGAKPIYINGQPSSADNYTLPGGQYLVYYDGTNYYFRTDDKMTGSITGNAATASSVAWANVSSKPNTATRWPQWDEIAAGAEALPEGTSNWTDHTEILTSYASNNGFADTNAKGVVYRRDAICAYNYIKGKLDSVYVDKSAGVTNIAWDSTDKKITKTINGTTSDVVTAETLKAAMNITAADLDISNVLHFVGITSTILADGSTTTTLTPKSTDSLNKTTGFVDGDVVMDGDQLREYVWSGNAWRLLGITTSSTYTQPASTATNTWIAQISQGTDGRITATTGSLDTSGTWSGNAGTATKLAASKTLWGQSFDGTTNITGNFTMSGGDQINMTSAQWDGFAFNYQSGKTDGQSIRFYNGATKEIVRFSANGAVGIGTTSNAYKLYVNGTARMQGPLYIGDADTTADTGYATDNSGSTNYIAFYGVYNDGPGSFNHTYIGESIYGPKDTVNEKSELLLFKGNDVNSTSGPDRIRLFANEVDIQVYTSTLYGTWDTIRATTGTQVANFKNGQVTITGNLVPEATNTRTLGTSSLKWNNVYATTFTGNLTGNVTGNVSGSSGSCTGNAATATTATTADTFSSGTTVELTGDTTGKSSSSTKGWSVTTTTKLLSGTAESDAALVTAPGTGKIRYSYNISHETTGLFAHNSNANSIITLNRHSGNYNSQLGFSSNGNIYYRNLNEALNNTTSWKQLAFTDSTVARANAVAWANVESKPDTATRWPAWDEVTGKPTTETLRDTLFPVTTYTKTVTLTTEWQDVGITGTDLNLDGTYIIQLYLSSTGANSLSSYYERYSGIMSWYKSITNSSNADEIVLHRGGHAPNNNCIYLRVQRSPASATLNTLRIQIKASKDTAIEATLKFKFRWILD